MIAIKFSIMAMLALAGYSTTVLLAQAAATTVDGWIDPVVRLTTAGGFGAMLWYLVAKRLPAIEAEHRAERLEWLAAHRQERDDSKLRFIQEVQRVTADWVKFSEQTTSALTALRAEVERRRDRDER